MQENYLCKDFLGNHIREGDYAILCINNDLLRAISYDESSASLYCAVIIIDSDHQAEMRRSFNPNTIKRIDIPKFKVGECVKIIHGSYGRMIGTITDYDEGGYLYTLTIGNLKGVRKTAFQITNDMNYLKEGDIVRITHGDYSDKEVEVISYNNESQLVAVRLNDGTVTYKDRDFVKLKKIVYPMIALCGNKELYMDIFKLAEKYTKDGWIVLFPFEGNEDVQMRMIKISDRLHVVIGDTHVLDKEVKNKIDYAKSIGKAIEYVTTTGIIYTKEEFNYDGESIEESK